MPVKLGELLLKENMITPQQFQDALNHMKVSGGTIREAFVSLGFVRDEEITSLLSRHFEVPSVNLDQIAVDSAVIKAIPAETARKFHVLPLSLAKKTLRLAMADPNNVFAIDDISFMTGFKVEPVVASESALEVAIDRYYGSARSLELQRMLAPETRGHPMRVSDLRFQLASAPDDAVVQLHVECRVEADGTTVMHEVAAIRVEIDRKVPGVGVVVAIEG